MQLIIHGSKHNRYSINALLGALESRGMLPSLPGTAFASKPPGILPPRLRKIINTLVATGKAFGNGQHQEKQARDLLYFPGKNQPSLCGMLWSGPREFR